MNVARTGILAPSENPAEGVMGGLLITIFVASILYGMTTLQTFIYSQKYTKDGTFLRLLVGVVWVFETLHTAFCIQFIYGYLITGFGDILNFIRVDWGVGIAVICSVVVGVCVQGYYTWRVWIVSGKSILWTSIIAIFALARVGFGIGSAALSYMYPDWIKLRRYGPALTTVSGGLGSAALVDLLVATTLTYFLKRDRNYGPHNRQSETMINRILLYTVNTGALTGAASLACVILFALKKDSLIFLGFFAIETKLYANSFLGSLNARSHLRNAGSHNGRLQSSRTRPGIQFSIPTTQGHSQGPVIEITRHTVTHDDHGEISYLPGEGSEVDLKVLKGGDLPRYS
ncbi:hypothetical protein K466DRAFT_582693 [Polyporus arcularius HHB13444]|uniref:DUF6534 domain-containing protein n=1 Tax=Polyporus arcularius HHB13444 TaxID=1314778 RepID=A0A5C3PPD6_9APHY|nr:hypothetical protein K466DRAFT_582693 [Polyporus arcularius HHB13444]